MKENKQEQNNYKKILIIVGSVFAMYVIATIIAYFNLKK